MNKCDICGKFRSYADLRHRFTPDNHFSGEESYIECFECTIKSYYEDEELEDNAKVPKKDTDK